MNASPASPAPTRVQVKVFPGTSGERILVFDLPFRIGRIEECELCIKDDYVSRFHAQVAYEAGSWLIRDLNSSNGIYVNGQRVANALLHGATPVRLGVEGPQLLFTVQEKTQSRPAAVQSETMVHRISERYFSDRIDDQTIGEHTMAVRKAFRQVQTKQKRRYTWIIVALATVFVLAGGYAIYEHHQVAQQTAVAENIFYSMKSLDVDIASMERVLMESQSPQAMEQIRKYRSRRSEMDRNYDKFISSLHVYDRKMSEDQKLMLRVARIFGECELDMPPGFVDEVKKYIQKWQSSGRLARAIRTAESRGYTSVITKELLNQGLPPQFFYLALQESDFDEYISGPMTHKGIAKGMWQFIPETAVKYGLRVGPLVDLRRPDPGDDRHHWEVETKAAARYLKDLYITDAQASGLLVMACYNWGETRVLPLVQKMPANPRERNFWQLLAKEGSKVPGETYDYVYYIFSAAVIGENPRLFGFDFDNPLRLLENR